MSEFIKLREISNWIRDEEGATATDPRNRAWALSAALTIEELTSACEMLIAQYRAKDNYTMGGALTNEPFLAIQCLVFGDMDAPATPSDRVIMSGDLV